MGECLLRGWRLNPLSWQPENFLLPKNKKWFESPVSGQSNHFF
jgi:hypothetical protein